MKKILSAFFGIDCGCGEKIAPFFSKKIKIRWGEEWYTSQNGRKCQKCGAVWLMEDGYWRLLKTEDLERRDSRLVAERKRKFVAPDLTKWNL